MIKPTILVNSFEAACKIEFVGKENVNESMRNRYVISAKLLSFAL